jgi:hypothetical protein
MRFIQLCSAKKEIETIRTTYMYISNKHCKHNNMNCGATPYGVSWYLTGSDSSGREHYGPVWYSFMTSFTSSFTTSIAKQPTLCPTLWSASLKTHSHRVKHMVKLQKHGSLPRSWSCSWSCFLKNSSTGEAELCQTGLYGAASISKLINSATLQLRMVKVM